MGTKEYLREFSFRGDFSSYLPIDYDQYKSCVTWMLNDKKLNFGNEGTSQWRNACPSTVRNDFEEMICMFTMQIGLRCVKWKEKSHMHGMI